MTAKLVIGADAYVLQQRATDAAWQDLAVMRGGAGVLLPPARPIDEPRLEAAIELAENWLMPHAASLRDQLLEVHDATGRLASGMQGILLEGASVWSVADLERLFLRLIHLATGRRPAPALASQHAFAADLLLLRELAHHGAVREVRLA